MQTMKPLRGSRTDITLLRSVIHDKLSGLLRLSGTATGGNGLYEGHLLLRKSDSLVVSPEPLVLGPSLLLPALLTPSGGKYLLILP